MKCLCILLVFKLEKFFNYKNENFMSIEKINYILDVVKNKKKDIDKEMQFISEEYKRK